MIQNRVIVKAVAAAILSSAAGLAAAADSQTLAVSATIVGSCKFMNVPAKSFGTAIDPSTTTDDIVVVTNVTYRCTTGTPSAGITATGGLSPRTLNRTIPSAATMAYTLEITGATALGTGFGTGGSDLTAVVTGTLAASVFQVAPAGTYTDNVTLNITP
jgi:spore coat protein U-like protein